MIDQSSFAAAEDRFGALRYFVYAAVGGALVLIAAGWLQSEPRDLPGFEVLIGATALGLLTLGLGVCAAFFYGGPTAIRIESSGDGLAIVFPNGRRRLIPWLGERACLVIDHSSLPSPSPLNPTGRALIQEPLRARTYISREGFEFVVREAVSNGWVRAERQLTASTVRSTLRSP